MAEERQFLQARYGAGLLRLRQDRQRTRQNVVDHNDISLNALASIENGQALVQLDTLAMLLHYYNTDMATFIMAYVDTDGSEDFQDIVTRSLTADTRFFILDTMGATPQNNYSDEDFVQYHWNAHQNNRVRTGDWFLYRRPQRANGKFWYFFGAGQVGAIQGDATGTRHAQIVNAVAFTYYLTPTDLTGFQWSFRERTRPDWQHFFNQYGMTEIKPQDFQGLLGLALGEMNADTVRLTPDIVQEDVAVYRGIHQGQFAVTEKLTPLKQRIGQAQLAETVRLNYHYQCAVTGIHTRQFLIASHIKPWAKFKEERLDPSNVICLSPLWDKAFDQGFVTFDAGDGTIRLAEAVQSDNPLYEALGPYRGRKLHLPKTAAPKPDFLAYHNHEVFLDGH